MSEQVAGEVDPAALVPGALEAAAERLDQASVLVGDDQPHAGQPAALEAGEEAPPERFVFGIADVGAQDLSGAADGSVRNATKVIAALTARADQQLAGGHPDTAADLLVKAWLALGNRR